MIFRYSSHFAGGKNNKIFPIDYCIKLIEIKENNNHTLRIVIKTFFAHTY